MSLYPVFIVGSPRSGTSILVRSLMQAGYFGFNEGNFLSIIREIDKVVDRHLDTFGASNKVLAGCVERGALKTRLENAVAVTAGQMQTRSPWVDKTGNPEMIEIIPVLRRIWPSSRFVFAKRRALENLCSRLKKFPAFSFEYHCADWARNMAAWREQTARDPALPGLEVDQHDISANPRETSVRLGDFLRLPPDMVEKLASTFTRDRPQQTEPGSADRVLSFDRLSWTPDQCAIFHRVCDAEMNAYGYTEDADYRVQL